MNEISVAEVSRRTGLSQEVCQDLLDNGWTYVERIDCIPRWESPLGRLVNL